MFIKKIILTSLLPAVYLLMPYALFSQSNHVQKESGMEDAKIVSFGRVADSLSLRNIFKKNTPKAFNASNLPQFAVIGKDRKFYLGIGGYLKGTASFDFGHPIDNGSYFTTSDIPISQSPGNGGLFQMSAQTSNLFFNFVAMPDSKHQIGAYINFNFAGNNAYDFDLQYAYLTYGDWMLGYNFSLFFDAAGAPPTIDMEGPSSLPAVQHTLLNYTYTHHPWSASIGVEAPQASYSTNGFVGMINQRIPDIPAYIQYDWDKGNSSLRLSSLLRNMQYRNLKANKNENKVGWGLQLSGMAQVKDPSLTFYYQGIYGKGVANFIQDTEGLYLDMVPDQNNLGKMHLVSMWGVMGGVQVHINSKIFTTHAYSQVRDYAKQYAGGNIVWKNHYKYAQYLVNNVFWQMLPSVQLGFEYIWGRLAIMSGDRRCDHRIQTMMQYNF